MFIKKWHALGLCFVISSAVLGSFGEAIAFPRTLNFCNKTDGNVDVAYGYEPAGSVNTQTKGWRAVQACQCVTLFSEDVRATELYVYVQKNGQRFSEGEAPLCIKAGKFQAGPANKSAQRCTESGGQWVKYLQVNAVQETHKLNFGSGKTCR